MTSEKGSYGGKCNVTRCSSPVSILPAVYYHPHLFKYYCEHCAVTINRVCVDFGDPLIFDLENTDEKSG